MTVTVTAVGVAAVVAEAVVEAAVVDTTVIENEDKCDLYVLVLRQGGIPMSESISFFKLDDEYGH